MSTTGLTKEQLNLALDKWADLRLLQEHYKDFKDFLKDAMQDVLGFGCSWMQRDIADFIASDNLYLMVQAQRGEAKTTISACYAVWRLIHNPKTRVLVVSAGDDMAKEISNLIVNIILTMPELECLRPDKSRDRCSIEAFDVHYLLRGNDKSPSVACLGITSHLQGRRADLLIADDIESSRNSKTAVQRAQLVHLTREFSSINSTGKILYLGTPQSVDSIYNSLHARGFLIRIWPGRYPTSNELSHYNGLLAPSIAERVKLDPSLQTGGGPTGTRGKPTDPDLLTEEKLCMKEIDQGPAYFQLQHMLDTRLTDEGRYPLKCRDLLFMNIGSERAPLLIDYIPTQSNIILPPQGFPSIETYYRAGTVSDELGYFTGCCMYVDPAGGGKNGDETAYAVTKMLNGKIFCVAAGGVPGGYEDEKLQVLTNIATKFKPNVVIIEENFGKGAFKHIWAPKLLKAHKCGIEEVWESGQKELRIIDTLEPIINSHKLIIDEQVLIDDWHSTSKYALDKRATYSLLFQLSKITRDRGSLIHDDRLDALTGACRYWVEHLARDEAKTLAAVRQDNYNKLLRDPLGNGRINQLYKPPVQNSLSKLRRKV